MMTIGPAIRLAGLSLALISTSAVAAPNVLVSIKPIHSLVASIMAGVGEPQLIVGGAASPHTYQMKPSQAASLQAADIVFWTGHGLEAFLEKPLETLGANAKIVELDDVPGLVKLKFREGGAFEAHADEGDEPGDHNAHGDDEVDMHLWLNTLNAQAMAGEIAKNLSEADPKNAARYQANLAALDTKLDRLETEIAATVAPVRDKPFIVFHDAYQYFENQFGVRVAGSITVSPEVMPGAERLSEIKAKMTELKAMCVFAEPQFSPKIIDVLLESTNARPATLDPEAATLSEGPELYFELMRSIANNLKSCLSAG